ncbi:unnamed protein product [Allacma fusca]|uniref:Uncharacterized protein n=1 Tax=Allacma fusca TaxID=39272 RepID=A0A8J2MAX0_9HEXA|nr:unnamed protein product [Allacma fusca]
MCIKSFCGCSTKCWTKQLACIILFASLERAFVAFGNLCDLRSSICTQEEFFVFIRNDFSESNIVSCQDASRTFHWFKTLLEFILDILNIPGSIFLLIASNKGNSRAITFWIQFTFVETMVYILISVASCIFLAPFIGFAPILQDIFILCAWQLFGLWIVNLRKLKVENSSHGLMMRPSQRISNEQFQEFIEITTELWEV